MDEQNFHTHSEFVCSSRNPDSSLENEFKCWKREYKPSVQRDAMIRAAPKHTTLQHSFVSTCKYIHVNTKQQMLLTHVGVGKSGGCV